jgi:hypothetical protein
LGLVKDSAGSFADRSAARLYVICVTGYAFGLAVRRLTVKTLQGLPNRDAVLHPQLGLALKG